MLARLAGPARAARSLARGRPPQQRLHACRSWSVVDPPCWPSPSAPPALTSTAAAEACAALQPPRRPLRRRDAGRRRAPRALLDHAGDGQLEQGAAAWRPARADRRAAAEGVGAVLAVDRDRSAVERARRTFARELSAATPARRLYLAHAPFSALGGVLERHRADLGATDPPLVDGILVDAGVSSTQVRGERRLGADHTPARRDRSPPRGCLAARRCDARLRSAPTARWTCAWTPAVARRRPTSSIVPASALAGWVAPRRPRVPPRLAPIARRGTDHRAVRRGRLRRVHWAAIVAHRPIASTAALADVVRRVAGEAQGTIDGATRTFQVGLARVRERAGRGRRDARLTGALRCHAGAAHRRQQRAGRAEAAHCGGAQASLRRGAGRGRLVITALRLRLLRPGGRLVVISFHSLEDRLVKRCGRDGSARLQLVDLSSMRAPAGTPRRPAWFLPATPAEVRRNARARSAKLRVLECIRAPP